MPGNSSPPSPASINRSASRAVCGAESEPVQHSETAKRDPATRGAYGAGQVFVKGIAVSQVQQPATVSLATFEDGRDGLFGSRIGPHAAARR